MGENARYDSVWKALPPTVLLALLRQMFPDIGEVIQPLPTEIRLLPDRQIDGAFLIDYHGTPTVFHLEYQQNLDKSMPLRIYHYDAMLKLKYAQDHNGEDIPILSIVIWATPTKEKTPEPIYRNRAVDRDLGTWPYFEIHLAQMDWKSADPIYMTLAPLTHGIGRDELEQIGEMIAEAAPSTLKLILLGAFLQLALWKFGDIRTLEQKVLAKAGVTMTDLFTAVAQSDIGIGLIAIGEAKGKAEGKIEGKAEALRKQWIKKFGEVTADVAVALKTVSDEAIDSIFEQMIDPAYTIIDARRDLGL